MTPLILLIPLSISFILIFKLFFIIKFHIKYSLTKNRINLIIYGISLLFITNILSFILQIMIPADFPIIGISICYVLLFNFLVSAKILFLAFGIISLLITCTDLSSNRIQWIGNVFTKFTIIMAIFITPTILIITLFCKFEELQVRAQNLDVVLKAGNIDLEKINSYLLCILEMLSLILGIVSLKLNSISGKFKRGKLHYIINITHLLYSLTNISHLVYFIMRKITNNKIVLSIINFWRFLVPGVFSLEFLMNEEWYRLGRYKYDVGKILRIKELKEYFKDYLYKRKKLEEHKLALRWEQIFKSEKNLFFVNGLVNLEKNKALSVIENILSSELDGFLFNELFLSYYSLRLRMNGENIEYEVDSKETILM